MVALPLQRRHWAVALHPCRLLNFPPIKRCTIHALIKFARVEAYLYDQPAADKEVGEKERFLLVPLLMLEVSRLLGSCCCVRCVLCVLAAMAQPRATETAQVLPSCNGHFLFLLLQRARHLLPPLRIGSRATGQPAADKNKAHFHGFFRLRD